MLFFTFSSFFCLLLLNIPSLLESPSLFSPTLYLPLFFTYFRRCPLSRINSLAYFLILSRLGAPFSFLAGSNSTLSFSLPFYRMLSRPLHLISRNPSSQMTSYAAHQHERERAPSIANCFLLDARNTNMMASTRSPLTRDYLGYYMGLV
jgi:hypothetical protein